MSETDMKHALMALKPKTKAAKLREVMPVIEERIAAGVRIGDILQILRDGGIELTEATLKSYLYRYRKKQGGVPNRQAFPSTQAPRASGMPRGEVDDGAPGSPPAAEASLADALDPKKRDELGNRYVNRQRPLFTKRSKR